ncbi:MAG TPA: hypothetical protein VIE18_06460 [Gaiellaceae bacterium]
MGLEDRDWYRERPSGAWSDWRGHAEEPRLEPTARPSLLGRLIVGALVIVASSLIAIAVLTRVAMPEVDHTPIPTPRLDAMRFELRWNPALTRRATLPTRWTLHDRRFGELGTLVVVVSPGEYALEVITDVLTARGFQVVLPWNPPRPVSGESA